jgi:hypothetical protein
LVRDNAHSTEYAARVTEYEGGELRVMPWDGMEARHIYRMHDDRDRLDRIEAEQLARLLAAYWSPGILVRRLGQALWTSEHLAWERYVDIILPAFVTALEGMLNTSKRQLTRQFVTRVPELAAELGISDVTKSFCRRMYEARSQGAHGRDIDLLKVQARREQAVKDVARLQAIVRAAVRHGIEDPAFRSTFDSEENIRARWPVEVSRRLWRWRSESL